MPRWTLFVLPLALFALGSANARAHHAISESGVVSVEPQSSARLDLEAGRYDYDGHSGSFFATVLAGEVAFSGRVSVGVRLPFAYVTGEYGTEGFGAGDIELDAKVLIYAATHGELILSAGLGVEAPTGDVALQLTGGHWALSPYVTASSALSSTIHVFASVVHSSAVSGSDDPPATVSGQALGLGAGPIVAHVSLMPTAPGAAHGSRIAPHATHETAGRVGIGFVTPVFYAAVMSTGTRVWQGDEVGLVTVGGDVGWLPITGKLRLALGFELPVAGQRRIAWRTRAGAAWLF